MNTLSGLLFAAFAALNPSDQALYDAVYAPKVTGLPPQTVLRDMCVMDDGEIRHYGAEKIGGSVRRVYASSLDRGLTWKTLIASEDDPGAMVKSPWSGEWITISHKPKMRLIRSKTGPGGHDAVCQDLPFTFGYPRQPIALKHRKRWICPVSEVTNSLDSAFASYRAVTLLSDDDGRTWRRTEPSKGLFIPPGAVPPDRSARWANGPCEPSVAELRDGTLWMVTRTSVGNHYKYVSKDGGETWEGPEKMAVFHSVNTMPLLMALSDGRLLMIWNNTQPLPQPYLSEYPESRGKIGMGAKFVTNRDALHAAVSDDNGRTWKGFREILLNPIRNDADFRETGREEPLENDKSVHQPQAVELPGGKILVAVGQNRRAQRFLVFDLRWLYERERFDDFRYGLGGLSNHLYVKGLMGNYRGWSGHCAFNRIPGAVLTREPDSSENTAREALQICRVRDRRLYSDKQGVTWNFPALRKGRLEVECRIEGEGFRLTLADRWFNPCDELAGAYSPFTVAVTPRNFGRGEWKKLVVTWDFDAKEHHEIIASVDGVEIAHEWLDKYLMPLIPEAGVSYLHIITLAEDDDQKGAYFRSFSVKGT